FKRVDDLTLRAGSIGRDEQGVVPARQLIAQIAAAAESLDDAKRVRSLHTVFMRPCDARQPVDLVFDTAHVGSTFSTVRAAVEQGGVSRVAALVFLDRGEVELIHHEPSAPLVTSPEET